MFRVYARLYMPLKPDLTQSIAKNNNNLFPHCKGNCNSAATPPTTTTTTTTKRACHRLLCGHNFISRGHLHYSAKKKRANKKREGIKSTCTSMLCVWMCVCLFPASVLCPPWYPVLIGSVSIYLYPKNGPHLVIFREVMTCIMVVFLNGRTSIFSIF